MRPLALRNYVRIARAKIALDQPVYAHWGITHRCGLTCKMCGIWRYGNKKEELDLDQVAVIARNMREIGVAQVALGGGEPLEREDLPEIVKIFVGEGLNIRVSTAASTPVP